jgi:hypothetical protein
MPSRLLACPSCARHVRTSEARCPFCGAPCPDSFAPPEPARPARGLTRAELRAHAWTAARVVGVLGGLTTSCGLISEPDKASSPDAASADASTTGSADVSTTGSTQASTTGSADASTSGSSFVTTAYGAPAPECGDEIEIGDGGVAVPGACSGEDYVTLISNYSCDDGGSPNACDLALLTGYCFGPAVEPCHTITYARCVDGSYSACSLVPPLDGSMQPLPDGAPEASAPADAGDGG